MLSINIENKKLFQQNKTYDERDTPHNSYKASDVKREK
jgi:hypothetical protein